MRSQIKRLLYINTIFIFYTSYKAVQLWPSQSVLSVALTILFFVIMLSGVFAYRANPKIYDRTWFRVLSWAGSIAMALWATFILISLPFDILHGIFALFGRVVPMREISLLIFATSIVLTSIGMLIALRGLRIKNVSIEIENLSPALQNFKIAQISDLHIGTTIRLGYVQSVVDRTNELNADVIFMTGDIADAHSESIEEHLRPLSQLKSRYGVFYVPGNHEYYWGPKALFEKLRSLNFNLLLNENKVIQIDKARLMIAGVTDPAGETMLEGHKPNAAKALAPKEQVDLKILLAHQPSACHEAEGLGANLQFSGHTHAGQFFPFSLFIGLVHKYSRGLYRHGHMWVYVNPGTGYWGPPDRLGVAPEISLIQLIRA